MLDGALRGHANAVQSICDSRRYARQAALRGELDSTALHAACEHGHEAVARILLQRSRDLLDVPNRLCQTPLHLSCERGHLSCARLLLDAAADDAQRLRSLLDSADSSGLTPLMRASVGGSAPLVELLVSRGAALDRIDQVGMTALFRACIAGHTACLELLLAARATLQPNVEGAKPLVAVLQRVRLLLAILSAHLCALSLHALQALTARPHCTLSSPSLHLLGQAEQGAGRHECAVRVREALRVHAGSLVGRRVRIVQGSPLVAPSFRFLGGEAGTAMGYDEASCELTISLGNPKFGQLNLHALAARALAAPAAGAAAAGAAAAGAAAAGADALADAGATAGARGGKATAVAAGPGGAIGAAAGLAAAAGTKARAEAEAEAAAQRAAASLLEEEARGKRAEAGDTQGSLRRPGARPGAAHAASGARPAPPRAAPPRGHAVARGHAGVLRRGGGAEAAADAGTMASVEETARHVAKEEEAKAEALALATAWREQETARQVAEKAARRAAAAEAAQRAAVEAAAGREEARQQEQALALATAWHEQETARQVAEKAAQRAAAAEVAAAEEAEEASVDAAEVGLAAMRAAMRRVSESSSVPPSPRPQPPLPLSPPPPSLPPPQPQPPPRAVLQRAAPPSSPAVAAIVRFAAANAAANASHEARLLAADAANAQVAAPAHQRRGVQWLVSCKAAPAGDERDDAHRLEELRRSLSPAGGAGGATAPAVHSVACNTEPMQEALELDALRAEVARLRAELHHARAEIRGLRLAS